MYTYNYSMSDGEVAMSYFGGKPFCYNCCYNYDHVIRRCCTTFTTFTTFIEGGASLGCLVHKHIVNDVNEISLAHLSSLSDFRFFIWLM